MYSTYDNSSLDLKVLIALEHLLATIALSLWRVKTTSEFVMTSYLKPIIVSSEETLHKIFNDLIPLKKKMVSTNVKIEYAAISLSSHYIRGKKKRECIPLWKNRFGEVFWSVKYRKVLKAAPLLRATKMTSMCSSLKCSVTPSDFQIGRQITGIKFIKFRSILNRDIIEIKNISDPAHLVKPGVRHCMAQVIS